MSNVISNNIVQHIHVFCIQLAKSLGFDFCLFNDNTVEIKKDRLTIDATIPLYRH
jgi:hypothetical protein